MEKPRKPKVVRAWGAFAYQHTKKLLITDCRVPVCWLKKAAQEKWPYADIRRVEIREVSGGKR